MSKHPNSRSRSRSRSPRPWKDSGIGKQRDSESTVTPQPTQSSTTEPEESRESSGIGKQRDSESTVTPQPTQSSTTEPEESRERSCHGVIQKKLDHGITVCYPHKYGDLPDVMAVQVGQGRQDEEYDSIRLGPHEKLLTQIYDIQNNSKKNTGSLRFDQEDQKYVTVTIGLPDPSPIYTNQKCTAHVKSNATWLQTTATYKDGVVWFNAVWIETFCVSCMPHVEQFVVLPTGGHFQSMYNTSVGMEFPSGAVKSPQKITVQVVPVDFDRIKDEHTADGNPSILAMSDYVDVHHGKTFSLLKPAKLKLSLDVSREDWTEEYALLDLHGKTYDDPLVEPLDHGNCDMTATSRGYDVVFNVKEFSWHQLTVAKRKKTTSFKKSIQLALRNLVKCNILTFIAVGAPSTKTKSLWLECVMSKKVDDIVKSREDGKLGIVELPQCRSPEVYIADGERIRVEVCGCGKVGKLVKKDYMFINFMCEVLDNHICFPIDITYGMDKSTHVFLNFTGDKNAKRNVHSAHFDPQIAGKRDVARRKSRSPYRTDNSSLVDVVVSVQHGGRCPVTPQISIREPTDLTIGDTLEKSSSFTTFYSRQSSLDVYSDYASDSEDQNIQNTIRTMRRATTPFGNAVFSDKSLKNLAKKLAPEKTLELGIELDLDMSAVQHIQHTEKNSVTVNLCVLKKWISLERDSAEDALRTLCAAMAAIGHNDIRDEVNDAFKMNRIVRDNQ